MGFTDPLLPALSSSSETLEFRCEFPGCTRSFAKKTGLGVHRRRAHPEFADQQINTEKVKDRWSAKESLMLARREAELTVLGSKFLNKDLAAEFTNRSLESIKGQRRKAQHKEKVGEFLQNLTAVRGVQDTGDMEEVEQLEMSPSSVDQMERKLLDFFDNLQPPDNNLPFKANELYLICREVRLQSREEILARISLYLQCIEPKSITRPCIRGAQQQHQSRRRKRRQQYARSQMLLLKSRQRCINDILEGASEEQPSREVMEAYWTRVLTQKSTGEPLFSEQSDEVAGIWEPITMREIKANGIDRKTSAGPDGFNGRLFSEIPDGVLLCLYNLILWCGRLPERLLGSRTIFIPKKGLEQDPSMYRPITISSAFVRRLHKILVARLEKRIHIDERQRGFRSNVDGCRDNTFQLDCILKKQHSGYRNLYMASLDIAKALPSVSHKALIGAMKAMGVPRGMIDYVENVYRDTFTILEGDGWKSSRIHPERGVRQGDPLSSPIFNMVINLLLQQLPKEIGVRIGGKVISAQAFVDDINYYATTARGLQKLIDVSNEFLGQCGMMINVNKSFTLGFKSSAKAKTNTVDIATKFKIGQHTLPMVRRTTEWKYLGIKFSWAGRSNIDPSQILESDLEKLTKGPLKPQQRIALRCFVLPRIYHQLVLGNVRVGALRKVDKLIRLYVRRWLHLPPDAPNAYFHTQVKQGGLGVPSLRWTIPSMRLARLTAMRTSDGLDGEEDAFLLEEIQACRKRLKVDGIELFSKEDIDKWWATSLYRIVDGSGLSKSAQTPGQHTWLSEGTRFLSGKDYINSNRLRIGALPTRARTARGREKDRKSRAGCDGSETVNHVLQICPRTHAGRIRRHNCIVEYVAKKFQDRQWTAEMEPRINTREGLRKPDLLLLKEDQAIVLDAQVVGEQFDLNRAHRLKASYYARNNGVVSYIINKEVPEGNIHFASITLNWKGVWSPKSAEKLRGWGLKVNDMKVISSRVIIGGLSEFRLFNAVTSTTSRDRHGIG